MLEDLRATGGVPDTDHEMYEEFEHPDEATWWYRLWTGSQEVDEGMGGYTDDPDARRVEYGALHRPPRPPRRR